MRILIHDYCGHPFQIQLSRSFAGRGHTVLHLYSGSIASPRGAVQGKSGDPNTLCIEEVSIGEPIAKYRYIKRRQQELKYGKLLIDRVRTFAPDIAICANTPIDILSALDRHCREACIPWVLWLQDIHSIAIQKYAKRKLPIIGSLAAGYYQKKERRLFSAAKQIIAISDDFVPIIERIGGPHDRVTVIENWAPLDEISPRPRDNPWSRRHGLINKFCFIYSGTLGLKHNPELLTTLAKHFQNHANVVVVIVSEGLGADYLAEKKANLKLENLKLLPWQPFAELPDVLGSADVLLTILERDAGVLSIPSKVLTNMCAARPQLLAVPPENLASRIILREKAGLVVAPDETGAWISDADRLLADRRLREVLGANAWSYAESAFDIERITDEFQMVIEKSLGAR